MCRSTCRSASTGALSILLAIGHVYLHSASDSPIPSICLYPHCCNCNSLAIYASPHQASTRTRQASASCTKLLNQIVIEMPPEHSVSNFRPLREPLGHTPLEAFLVPRTWQKEDDKLEAAIEIITVVN